MIGVAVVAAVSTAKIPLAAALLGALATWVVVALGGYPAQAALLPSWQRDVRDLAVQRHDAARDRRSHSGSARESSANLQQTFSKSEAVVLNAAGASAVVEV